jgi:uncharacterized protein YlxW (UPF0749 family)
MLKIDKWQGYLFVVLFFLGILITVQFRTQQNFLNDLSLQKTEDLVMMLKKLYDKRSALEEELRELHRQTQIFQQDVSEGTVLAENLRQELERLEIALGLVPVRGPGIAITITSESPLVYLDLVDIINELWASGAEAIAINDQRITSWTKIYWDKNTFSLTINDQKLRYPCTIKAIGDPVQLESGLRLVGGVLDDLNIYKIYPVITREEELEIPAAAPPQLHYISGSA